MSGRAAPRIYGIPAADAPVVAIIRRGPSDWCHVGRWDLASDIYEPGAWFHGTLYPQKCDLSPDGRYLAYSAMKVRSDWPAGDIYEAVSRLPWLTALGAWNSGTTYTRGMHFVADGGDVGAPDVGYVSPCPWGLRWTRTDQFAVERRRGWVESEETPEREVGGHWDEKRRVEMVKWHGDQALHVEGRYAAFRVGDPEDGPPVYWVTRGDEVEVLEGVQWADWDRRGRLVAATTDGRLAHRSASNSMWAAVADLAGLAPEPRPAPAWAAKW